MLHLLSPSLSLSLCQWGHCAGQTALRSPPATALTCSEAEKKAGARPLHQPGRTPPRLHTAVRGTEGATRGQTLQEAVMQGDSHVVGASILFSSLFCADQGFGVFQQGHIFASPLSQLNKHSGRLSQKNKDVRVGEKRPCVYPSQRLFFFKNRVVYFCWHTDFSIFHEHCTVYPVSAEAALSVSKPVRFSKCGINISCQVLMLKTCSKAWEGNIKDR